MSKRVLVLGGDGFCGWPTSLRLSQKGYAVTIVDNLSRRDIDRELECSSLTPIRPITTRIRAWREVSNNSIAFAEIDLATDFDELCDLISEVKPHAIVHFAEQRAAPYSMKSPSHKRYTVFNNINATHNLLCAVVKTGVDAHIVHLGTMGVYGYDTGLTIPEGYLKVLADEPQGYKEVEILYPASPGSIYHLTKSQDALMFAFYNKNDGIRITDLHQGIVWGTNTSETSMDERLINRFDYDGDYGTVLNRFLMQAAVGHPLTVHGTGGQTRAFIHIRDTVNCIDLAIENPPAAGGKVDIFNQVTEVHTVHALAETVSEMTGAPIRYYGNPRKEAAENELDVKFEKFLGLGLKPITLGRGLLEEVVGIAEKYKDACDRSKIVCTSAWNDSIEIDYKGSSSPVRDGDVSVAA